MKLVVRLFLFRIKVFVQMNEFALSFSLLLEHDFIFDYEMTERTT